jgi:hypothetical protein
MRSQLHDRNPAQCTRPICRRVETSQDSSLRSRKKLWCDGYEIETRGCCVSGLVSDEASRSDGVREFRHAEVLADVLEVTQRAQQIGYSRERG